MDCVCCSLCPFYLTAVANEGNINHLDYNVQCSHCLLQVFCVK